MKRYKIILTFLSIEGYYYQHFLISNLELQGTRIEAYASIPTLIERYRVFPREGEVYHFENFKVQKNSDEFSVTDHPHKLLFYLTTKIKESNASIPASEYNFVSVKEIVERSARNVGLIGDVYASYFVFLYIFPSSGEDVKLKSSCSFLFNM